MNSLKNLQNWVLSKPVKAVGITQSVDGCMASQLEEMLSKIEDFGTTFHDGWVPRRYAWLGLRSTIWPLLSYPLVACSFSKAEADCLMLALYKLILLTLGASKSLLNVYHFAPLSQQGLEAPKFFMWNKASARSPSCSPMETPATSLAT